MTLGRFIVCLLIAGGMTYAGYLMDLPRALYIATGAGIFIIALNTGMK